MSDSMTVELQSDNTWAACRGEEVVQGGFHTMAAAWRWVDRYEGDPVNSSEKRAGYGFEQSALKVGTFRSRFSGEDWS